MSWGNHTDLSRSQPKILLDSPHQFTHEGGRSCHLDNNVRRRLPRTGSGVHGVLHQTFELSRYFRVIESTFHSPFSRTIFSSTDRCAVPSSRSNLKPTPPGAISQ